MKYIELLNRIAERKEIPTIVSVAGMTYRLTLDDHGRLVDYMSPDCEFLADRLSAHPIDEMVRIELKTAGQMTLYQERI